MTVRKKGNRIKIAVLFSAVLALAILTAAAVTSVNAENYRLLAEWAGGTYDVGDEINFEISLTGIEAGRNISGKITANIIGLEILEMEQGPGFGITSGRTPGTLVIEFSSEGGYIPTAVGKAVLVMMKCRIGSDKETSMNLSGEYVDNGAPGTIPTSIFTVSRVYSATEEPTLTSSEEPTLKPTIPPSSEPTPTPTPTMAVIETPSPSATNAPQTADTGPDANSTPEIIIPGKQTDGQAAVDESIPVGAVVFWTIVGLTAGIWIGIGIGALIWRKKTSFLKDEERKIIGKK